jgi:hypothetical protein
MGLWLGLGGLQCSAVQCSAVQVGGSMGLWLGLGVLQAVQLATNCVLPRLLSTRWGRQLQRLELLTTFIITFSFLFVNDCRRSGGWTSISFYVVGSINF